MTSVAGGVEVDESAGRVMERLRILVGETLALPAERVLPETRLLDLGASSLDVVELAMHLEDVFGVQLGEKDVAAAETVAGVAALLVARGARCA